MNCRNSTLIVMQPHLMYHHSALRAAPTESLMLNYPTNSRVHPLGHRSNVVYKFVDSFGYVTSKFHLHYTAHENSVIGVGSGKK